MTATPLDDLQSFDRKRSGMIPAIAGSAIGVPAAIYIIGYAIGWDSRKVA